MVSVLFVCLGNICRSPTAEGVFREVCARDGVSDRVVIDSAGTGGWHAGHPPDDRAQAAALQRGIDLSQLRARQVNQGDFDSFDWVLAMDAQNLADLQGVQPSGSHASLRRFLDFASGAPSLDVPDPYYGGAQGFEHVLDLVEDASCGLLAFLRAQGRL